MTAERRLAFAFARTHALDAARTLERLPQEERSRLLQDLPQDAAAVVLPQMEISVAAITLGGRPAAEVAALLALVSPQVGARLLERLEFDERQAILAEMPAESSKALRRRLRYGSDTAGALMDPNVVAFPMDSTIDDARTRVQREPQDLRYYVYVVDRADRLVGVVTLRELLQAPRSATLASVMRSDVAKLSARVTREAILAHDAWRDFHALPVVDREGVLVGVLRYATLRKLEHDRSGDRSPRVTAVGLALGELYWSAATALLYGAFDAIGQSLSCNYDIVACRGHCPRRRGWQRQREPCS